VTDKNQRRELLKYSSEAKILEVLREAGKAVRYKDLKRATRLSSATLSARLASLAEKGMVRRIVNESTYPPAVLYQVTSQGQLALSGAYGIPGFLDLFMEERRHSREILMFRRKGFDTREVIEAILRDHFHDLLFTLNYAVKKPEHSWAFILMHINLYEAELENIIQGLNQAQDPSWKKAVEEIYEEAHSEQISEMEKAWEEAAADFKDKKLAAAAIYVYIHTYWRNGKGKAEFLTDLSEKKELRAALEERSGHTLTRQELTSLIKDKAWTTFKMAGGVFSPEGIKTQNSEFSAPGKEAMS
jgi:DNA-binding HxlR family transcriptional regulator